jgi:hypothetical protein
MFSGPSQSGRAMQWARWRIYAASFASSLMAVAVSSNGTRKVRRRGRGLGAPLKSLVQDAIAADRSILPLCCSLDWLLSKETPEIARRAVGSRYDRCSGGRRSSAAVARCNRGAVTPTASWAFGYADVSSGHGGWPRQRIGFLNAMILIRDDLYRGRISQSLLPETACSPIEGAISDDRDVPDS